MNGLSGAKNEATSGLERIEDGISNHLDDPLFYKS